MKIIISCNKLSLLMFFSFLLFIVFSFSFATVYETNKIVLNNEESRIKFMQNYGFSEMSLINEPKEIIIPIKPSNEYKKYLEEQKNYGWNLYKFSGKELQLHSYKNNHHFVNLFLKDNVLVGADYCELENGFLKPFDLKNED